MEDVLARHGNGQKAPGPVRRPPKRYLPPKSLSSLQVRFSGPVLRCATRLPPEVRLPLSAPAAEGSGGGGSAPRMCKNG